MISSSRSSAMSSDEHPVTPSADSASAEQVDGSSGVSGAAGGNGTISFFGSEGSPLRRPRTEANRRPDLENRTEAKPKEDPNFAQAHLTKCPIETSTLFQKKDIDIVARKTAVTIEAKHYPGMCRILTAGSSIIYSDYTLSHAGVVEH